ncbi:MAG: tetratricopeptide repeat protein [Deltaproteobacteria bacterium]|nr:tetratricopeptide repeat protein [Candidatus Zymogenaceae bacterium]
MKVHCSICGFDGNIWKGLVPPEGKETECPFCGAQIFIPGPNGGDAAIDDGVLKRLSFAEDELPWHSDEGRRDEPRLPLFDGLPVSAEIRVSTKAERGVVAEQAEPGASVIEDDETYGFVNPSVATSVSEIAQGKEKKSRVDETQKAVSGEGEGPHMIRDLIGTLTGRLATVKHAFQHIIGKAVQFRSLLLAAAAAGLLFFFIGYVVNLAGGKMDTQMLSEEYREKADVKDEELDYIKAAEYYAVSIHIDPTNYKSLNNMASMYLQIHRYEDAIELLDEAISIIETDDAAVSYANRGLAYLGLGRYDRALEDLNTALTISPDLSYAYTARGFCYLAMEERERALLEFETACDLGDRNGCLLYDEYLVDDDE